jgi:xanthine dehydrogenase large subunit
MSRPLHHESALAHLRGEARYLDDLPEPTGLLHLAPVCSKLAHGQLRELDPSAALALPGVVAVLTAADLPGPNRIASMAADEPILAEGEVCYAGQVLALVAARSHRVALAAAACVRVTAHPLPALLELDEAIAAQSWISPPVVLERGAVDDAMRLSPHRLSAERSVGAQEHFYLEGQVAIALPDEQGGWTVHSSTQHPGEVQQWVAHALGTSAHQVRVLCRRMGGGFGGKETQAGQVAVWAAVASRVLQQPVKMRLDRDDDFRITGKRHPFRMRYKVGFDDEGRILALEAELASNCGFSADLSVPVNERALFHVDNAYFLPNLRLRSLRCRTHLQSHTAFRGFGGPQGMYLIESLIGDIARALGRDAFDIRVLNTYGAAPRNTTPYGMTVDDEFIGELMHDLARSCGYRKRRQAIADAAAADCAAAPRGYFRGLALTPVKFGISFNATQFNQAGALVQVYTDATVAIHHGGTEMGQGLHTKVIAIVAQVLGLPPERLRVMPSDTHTIANASATAASAGTDLNGRAAERAAVALRERLFDFWAAQSGWDRAAMELVGGRLCSRNIDGPCAVAFEELVHKAYTGRVQLWAEGFYATPGIHFDQITRQGKPFYYFAWGAACSEVEIDVLTGEYRILAVDILHDVGRSVHEAIDHGQVVGGFVQGMGWLTTEELVWDDQGRLLTHAPSTYKIPTAADVPEHFTVRWWPFPNRVDNVGGSKAVGEPPLMLALSVIEALRDAVAQARSSSANPLGKTVSAGVPRVDLDAPATPERVYFAVRH